jgi:hypothetical protein
MFFNVRSSPLGYRFVRLTLAVPLVLSSVFGQTPATKETATVVTTAPPDGFWPLKTYYRAWATKKLLKGHKRLVHEGIDGLHRCVCVGWRCTCRCRAGPHSTHVLLRACTECGVGSTPIVQHMYFGSPAGANLQVSMPLSTVFWIVGFGAPSRFEHGPHDLAVAVS